MESDSPIVSLVGLGATGRVLGRQLTRLPGNFKVVGYDQDADRIKSAVATGAIDEGQLRFDRAVSNARLVILAEPPNQIIETLAVIGEHLRPATVVTDIAPEKARILDAAERLLPDTVSFVGGHPILRSAALATLGARGEAAVHAPRRRRGAGERAQPSDLEAATVNPFAGMPYCLIPLPSAESRAVQMMIDLVKALGAEPLFIGAAEHDGLVAGTHLLPRLVALAQLGVAGRSASVRDLERLAGSGLQFALEVDADDEEQVLQAVEAHPEQVALWLDQLLAELEALRAELAAGQAGRIAAWIATTNDGRARWRASAAALSHDAARFVLLDETLDTRGGWLGRFGPGRRRPRD